MGRQSFSALAMAYTYLLRGGRSYRVANAMVGSIPRVVILALLLIVPSAINLYLILRAGGIFRTNNDLYQRIEKKTGEINNNDAQ